MVRLGVWAAGEAEIIRKSDEVSRESVITRQRKWLLFNDNPMLTQ